MPVFTELYQRQQVASLPDGSLISWLAVPGDDSSRAVAFLRKTRDLDHDSRRFGTTEIWISPGNGWEPESLDVLEFPVKVILLGDEIAADDYLPPLQSCPTVFEVPQLETLTVGGTYPRDVALQCASTIWADADRVEPKQVIAMAERFAEWLTPVAEVEATLVEPFHDTAPGTPPGYFAGGVSDD